MREKGKVVGREMPTGSSGRGKKEGKTEGC